ncbi:uncharacterized protein LOC142103974 [Mixophyes fleayi]|uniref:uncharacterized protein LOC142103974 n=1 Tax=Mixophyes fleayi TaxID=3061075 RepID=UPI003F4E151A
MQRLMVIFLVFTAWTVITGLYLPVKPVEPDNSTAHNRTLRQTECYDGEYPHKGNCCRLCPAGTHVSEHCTMNYARGSCKPCSPGKDHTAGPNGLEQCIFCRKCRTDQVLVQECTPKTNAECQCKPGLYCSPEEPCEACSRCSRCPVGQRVKEQCTATKDTICEDIPVIDPTLPKQDVTTKQMGSPDRATELTPGNTQNQQSMIKTDPDARDRMNGSGKDLFWVPLVGAVSITAVVCIFLAVCHLLSWKEKLPHAGSQKLLFGPSTNPSENSTPLIERNIPITAERVQEEVLLVDHEHESVHPETVTAQKAEADTPGTESNLGDSKDPEPIGDDVDDVECEESKLGAAPCRHCGQAPSCDCQWTDFIYTVIDHVRSDNIVRLVRQLHLNETNIDRIIRDNPNNSAEQHYKLLECWRSQNGKQANMENVLRVLGEMGQGGSCENIVNNLRLKQILINSSWKN